MGWEGERRGRVGEWEGKERGGGEEGKGRGRREEGRGGGEEGKGGVMAMTCACACVHEQVNCQTF